MEEVPDLRDGNGTDTGRESRDRNRKQRQKRKCKTDRDGGEICKKKELALQVIERLKKEYPDTGCSLDYDDAWKLLVSVRLAAQCTDARVNVVAVSYTHLTLPTILLV